MISYYLSYLFYTVFPRWYKKEPSWQPAVDAQDFSKHRQLVSHISMKAGLYLKRKEPNHPLREDWSSFAHSL